MLDVTEQAHQVLVQINVQMGNIVPQEMQAVHHVLLDITAQKDLELVQHVAQESGVIQEAQAVVI